MAKIGYARVSSSSQDLDIQKAKLKAAGCEVIRSETISGASRDDRSEWGRVRLSAKSPFKRYEPDRVYRRS